MPNPEVVKKLKGREIREEEFLKIIKEAYLKTTGARQEIFQDSLPNLKEVYRIKMNVRGKVTVGDAQICAGTYTVLDQGI